MSDCEPHGERKKLALATDKRGLVCALSVPRLTAAAEVCSYVCAWVYVCVCGSESVYFLCSSLFLLHFWSAQLLFSLQPCLCLCCCLLHSPQLCPSSLYPSAFLLLLCCLFLSAFCLLLCCCLINATLKNWMPPCRGKINWKYLSIVWLMCQ